MKQILKKIGLTTAAVLPFGALAQVNLPTNTGGITGQTLQNTAVDVGVIINNITSWVSGLLIAVAVLFVIYAAYLYLTSAGDAEKVKSASNYILYAVIAVVVALASRGLIALGRAIFGF
ncbi:MAG: hypothetical protein HYW34_01085 [Candidatus Brennerbacteria bacterium]|nr:hypothetical protein [Candidatus Brennerbacteria bacterium]